MKNKLVKGDACIIGEPTGLTSIVIAEKGALWLELTIYGIASHGSLLHLRINIAEKVAKVIVSFEKLKELFKEKSLEHLPRRIKLHYGKHRGSNSRWFKNKHRPRYLYVCS